MFHVCGLLLSVVCCVLFCVCVLFFVVCCVLFVGCWLFVNCCCLLFVMACFLCVGWLLFVFVVVRCFFVCRLFRLLISLCCSLCVFLLSIAIDCGGVLCGVY